MSIILGGPAEQSRNNSFATHTFKPTLGTFSRVIIMVLLRGIIVHPGIVH